MKQKSQENWYQSPNLLQEEPKKFSTSVGDDAVVFFFSKRSVKFRRKDFPICKEVTSHFLDQIKNMVGYRTLSRDIMRCHITRADLNTRLFFHINRSGLTTLLSLSNSTVDYT